jgi:hypothetical protein
MGTFRLSIVAALMASAAPCFADPAEIARLEDSANKAMLTGEVMAGTGGAAMFAGIALLVASSWSGDDACGGAGTVELAHHRIHAASHNVGSGGVGGGPTGEMATSCGDPGLAAGGGILLILGMGSIITGSLYRDGAKHDLARADRLRRQLRTWSVSPKVNAQGAGVQLAVKF